MIRVLEILFVLFVVIMLITQVIIPAIRGRILFPIFGRTAKLEHDLAEANQEVAEVKLEQEVEAVKQHAKEVFTPRMDKEVATVAAEIKAAKPRKPRAKKVAIPKP